MLHTEGARQAGGARFKGGAGILIRECQEALGTVLVC